MAIHLVVYALSIGKKPKHSWHCGSTFGLSLRVSSIVIGLQCGMGVQNRNLVR